MRSAPKTQPVGLGWYVIAPLALKSPLIYKRWYESLNQQTSAKWRLLNYMIFCVVAVLFVLKFVPGTKEKSLEEIELIWERQ